MEGIGKFFDKFRNKAIEQIRIREIISDSIKVYTKYTIEAKNISINNGIIKISGPQILKNEIFIKKQDILKSISEQISNTKFTDIH